MSRPFTVQRRRDGFAVHGPDAQVWRVFHFGTSKTADELALLLNAAFEAGQGSPDDPNSPHEFPRPEDFGVDPFDLYPKPVKD